MRNSLPKTPTDPDRPVLTLLVTLADTTWRIAVPTVVLALAGLKLDLVCHTALWFTLTGTIIGFGFAALLVRRQLKDLS